MSAVLIICGAIGIPSTALADPPQVWNASESTVNYPSQNAALAAIHARGGRYALAQEVQIVSGTATRLQFHYSARPRPPIVGEWQYTGNGVEPGPVASAEQAAQLTLANFKLKYPECGFQSIEVVEDWKNFSDAYGMSSTQTRILKMDATSPNFCSRTFTVQHWKKRAIECPKMLGWDGKQCVSGIIASVYGSPIPCDQCDLRGNPVSVVSGSKVQREVDVDLEWFQLYRTFDSSFRMLGGIGGNWTHNLNVRLYSASGGGIAVVVFPSGSILGFSGLEAIDGSGVVIKKDGSGHVLFLKDGRYRFNSSGRLNRIERYAGDALDIEFDGLGRISRVVHSTGRSLEFGYADDYAYGESELAFVKDQDGILVTYSFDDLSRLTGVAYRDGTSRHYLYEDAKYRWLLTGVEDETGARYATYAYNDDGLAVASEHAGGVQKHTFQYGSDGATTYTNPLGVVERVAFTPATPYRKIASSTTLAGTESWEYAPYSGTGSDFRRRVKSHTQRNGRIDLYAYQDLTDPVLGDVRIKRVTEASNRPEANVTEVWKRRDTNQIVKQVSGARTQTWQYNARGQVIQESTVTTAGQSRTTTYSYCDQINVQQGCPVVGLLLSVDGPMPGTADTVSYTYYAEDAPGCASGGNACTYRKGDLRKTVQPLGSTTEVLAYNGDGRPHLVMDPNGVVTEYRYTPRGWLASTTVKGPDDASSADDRVTSMEYLPTGQVSRTTAPDRTVATYEYDAAQRLIKVGDGAGNSIHYTLDAAGNRVHESYRGSDGAVTRAESRVYNGLSQLVTLADAYANPTDYGYDAEGNQVSATSPLGKVSQQEYDSLNRLKRTLQDVGGIGAESRFKYDTEGNVVEVTDPKGLKTTYARNGFGQVLTQTSPDTGITTFTYDTAGNVLTRTDARGVSANYSYDALGRTTAVTFSDPAADIHYVYDQPSSHCAQGERAGIGRLASMIDSSGRTDYCYSAIGDLVRRVQVVEGQALTLRYAYEASGRLQSMTYPDGSLVDYSYDALGQVSSLGVTPAGGTREVLMHGLQTLPFGPEKTWTFGNGRRLDRSYDLNYRPQSINDARDGLNVGFGFDPAGNITSLTDGGPHGQGATLDYDALGRLTAFKDAQTGVAIEQYTYDATGNRLSFGNSAGVQAYVYPAGSHRLMSVDGVDRTYDAMGNTLTIGGDWQYVYDLAGRLGSATKAGSAQASYRHNAAGQRVLQQVGTDTTLHLHGEGGEWLGSYGESGVPAQQVVWLGSRPVGLIEAGKVLYIESDHLGSPRAVIDPQRDVAVWRWSLLGEAYGNGLPADDADQDGIPQSFDLRFPGQRYDSKSGLSYNYYRDYDARTGRYVQSDPIGLEGGVATFAYAGSNPIINLDPSGLSTLSMCARPENVLACAAAGIGSSGSAGTSSSGLGAAGVAAAASLARDSAKTQDDCPVQNKCEKIYATIRTILAVVKKRYWDMRQDGMDLFTTRPTGKMSWAGHQQQFRSWQVNLRGYLEVADSMNCRGYPSDAWEWATKPVPNQPAPR
ncbi:RHS repeat-associated core domain-containing protein [Stenotrophomonas sp. PD6]|uniref:RHS repeat-associated core domain-containing protein n=1 Tax=Stenotrophomonas sp. PD6 TaxID=3368612 RepID=UPI003BA23E55